MGILQRVVSMTKAAANEMLDKIENPVMMLNHYLRDLDEEIVKAEQAMEQQQVQERMLQAKLNDLNEQAGYYDGKAEQALAAEREVDARMALEAKLLYQEQAEETTRLQQLAKQAVLDLELHVQTLKEEKIRLQGKHTELITRVRHTGTPGHKSVQPLQGSAASRGFERIEMKVMEWEAGRELAKGSYGVNAGRMGFDQQQEQRSARVDEELKRLLQKKPSG
ncbi:PspA/IM30 family protein [Paenibacillus prosopidis]|uniref:Phage shock protein A (PspA) family protein n=1 Tax=Paenibacillus prosopidis TaxID=630520 RepID=A0A368W9F2_9BACL|nr:PspA/IM30 family protein [Paenibacillus prosopidis]RCW51706.1 phage shock protein A (PspA) family protein [Paenibacillus prosopidis]